MRYRSHSQHDRFAEADAARTAWIEGTPTVREHEARIFAHFEAAAGPVLEVGAGEGLTLRFRPELATGGYVGTDIEPTRAHAIRAQAPAGTRVAVVACDALHLPFRGGSFGAVLCRDLLHHLAPAQRWLAVAEMARVLRPDGAVVIIEPNGHAPWVAAFALLVPTEREALAFGRGMLEDTLRSSFAAVEVAAIEPSMAYRALFHYRFGLPRLGRLPGVRRALRQWESWVRRLVPERHWGYLVARCRGPRSDRDRGAHSEA